MIPMRRKDNGSKYRIFDLQPAIHEVHKGRDHACYFLFTNVNSRFRHHYCPDQVRIVVPLDFARM